MHQENSLLPHENGGMVNHCSEDGSEEDFVKRYGQVKEVTKGQEDGFAPLATSCQGSSCKVP